MLKLNNYICAVDIGSSKVAACVAQIKRKRIQNIFFESLPTKGVKNGAIVDSIELVGTVSKLLKNLKAKSGISIKLVHVNMSGQDVISKHSRAILPLAERGNKVITASDIEKVNEQARILGSSLEEDIIHYMPSSYAIDSKSNVSNPLGLYSHRLEVDLYLICGKLSSVQSLSRVINQAGYDIKDLFFSGLSTSKVVLTKELKEGMNVFCDIGSDVTELLLFRDGLLHDVEILPFGGNELTETLQEELKIPFDLAEETKRSYGAIGDPAQIGEDKEILVKKSNIYKPIKQRAISEIVSKSGKCICAKIKGTLEKKVSCYEVNNFIVAGRTIMLEGFIETLENCLAIPVKLARIANPDIPAVVKENSDLSGQKYLMYLTSLGMLCDALSEDKTLGIAPSPSPTKNPVFKAINRFKEVYQEYF